MAVLAGRIELDLVVMRALDGRYAESAPFNSRDELLDQRGLAAARVPDDRHDAHQPTLAPSRRPMLQAARPAPPPISICQADSFSWYQLSAAAGTWEPSYRSVRIVFVFVQVFVVVIVVIIIVVIVEVVVLVFFLFVLGLVGVVGPALGLLGGLEIQFVPGIEVQFLDLTVEILDFHELVVLVHGQDPEGFFFFLVLVPLAGDRCVFSAHEFKPLCWRGESLGGACGCGNGRYCVRSGRFMSTSLPLTRARRIVVKVGSALLVDQASGQVNRPWLETLVEDLLRLRARNQEVVLVSSGAIALGRRELKLPAEIGRAHV